MHRYKRSERVSELIRREISIIIDQQLRDKRIGMVTVTGVDDDITDGDIEYTITLEFTSVDNNYDGKDAEISATNEDVPIEADFTITSARMGEAPFIAQFRDASLHDDVYDSEWWWSFGDGETSDTRSPSHTYQNEGTYTVTLTVSNEGGDSTETKVDYVVVDAGLTPAQLEVRNLYVEPQYAKPRQEIRVSAKVYNAGGAWGSATVNLLINGETDQSIEVGVAPGTAQTVSFTVYRTEAREYQVQLLDAVGTFYVMEEEEQTAPSGYGPLDSGGIIAIVVIGIILLGGLIVIFLFKRR